MSRGNLDDATLEAIDHQLPDFHQLRHTVRYLSPDFISAKFGPSSTIPAAAACLQDTLNTLSEARYALHETLAHRVWYLEKSEPRNDLAAIFYTRFYADDIALRLYSASEHLAEAIKNMIEITKQELAPYEAKRVSRQSTVGHYLLKEKPGHPVTAAISQLKELKEWEKTIQYRGEWVHSQPPLIDGLGIAYKRGQRWRLSASGDQYMLSLGGGDEPVYSVEDLVNFVRPALFKFTDTVRTIVDYYVGLLKARGVTVGENGLEMKLFER